MADLNSYKEVTQLGEDVEYPDGYNCVEVTGSGDESTVKVFPTIVLSGPTTLSSDGVTVGTIVVEINDPNSDNPFWLDPDQMEEASLSGPQDLSVTYWITDQPKVYETEDDMNNNVNPVPDAYVEYSENNIHISDDWAASNAPAGWSGFYTQQAWVKYNGQKTASIEDGLQTVAEWWTYGGDEESQTEADVSGKLYNDAAAKEENTSSTIGVPNVRGQSATAYFYYRPDAGEEGIAYMNAEWEGGTDLWPISVTCGSYAGASLSLDPDPGTIAPGETSLCTLTVENSDGGALTGAVVDFYVQKGSGTLNPGSATLTEKTGEEEEVTTTSNTEFSVSHPIIRITSITLIGAGSFSWNGTATIDGSSVQLKDQTFPASVVPLTVVYDWGGEATTIYTATGDADGSKVYIGAELGAGVNALCSIDIDSSSSGSDVNISVSADPGSIDQSATSAVTCVCTDASGNPVSSGITFTLTPQKGRLSMAASSSPISNEEGSISSVLEVSVNYPPASVGSITSITFNGNSYTAASIDGTTITISGSGFGVASGTALVSYTPAGMMAGTYTAVAEDYEVGITASYGGAIDTCWITVGSGDDDGDGDKLDLTASPTEIMTTETSEVTATVTNGGTPVSGKSVSLTIASGPGSLSSSGGTTDDSGEVKATFSSNAAGTAKVNATYGSLTKTEDIRVTVDPDDDGDGDGDEEETMTLPAVNIVGEIDPATKTFTLTGGATIDSWGIAEDADQWGCVDGDPANVTFDDGYLLLYCSNNAAMAWDIKSVAVTGATFVMSAMQKMDPFYLDAITVGIQWGFALNAAREQKLSVVDKSDSSLPVVGAKVTIGGQTATTDQTGTAKFTGLGVGTYDVSITHPNYQDNRAGAVGGTGVYDSDTTNDQYTVTEYSSKRWILSKMSVSISITYTVIASQFYRGYGPGT